MAKKRTQSAQIIRMTPPRPVAPIIRVSAPRAAPHKKTKHHRRGGGGKRNMMAVGVGGFVVGFIEKSFPTLPTLPMIGRKGAIALGLYMFGPKGGILADAAIAAAAIAGYELGKTGTISGDVLGSTLAPQVSGVAAQV